MTSLRIVSPIKTSSFYRDDLCVTLVTVHEYAAGLVERVCEEAISASADPSQIAVQVG
jgi:hypothetical protein